MPAVPKRRSSKGRRDRRRSHHKVDVTVVKDKDSGEVRVPHRVDLTTGKYKGIQIMEPKE